MTSEWLEGYLRQQQARVMPGPPREDGGVSEVAALARAVLRNADGDKLTAVQDILVREALALTHGNKTAAARLLGVHRKIIERRLRDIAEGAS